jgi:hypothetical protein
MKRKLSLILLITFCFSIMGFGRMEAKAAYTQLVSISVEKPKILKGNLQSIILNFEDNSVVQDVAVTYKTPEGVYTQYKASRTTAGYFQGYKMVYTGETQGFWEVTSLIVNYKDGSFSYLEDVESGGYYQLDGGNFTSFDTDSEGPVFKSISLDKNAIMAREPVTITVEAEDELSSISKIDLEYKLPNDSYVSFAMNYAGNNQYQYTVPDYMTFQWFGTYECMSVTLYDTNSNRTIVLDTSYNIPSTKVDLSSGDFLVKTENQGPTLKNIYVSTKVVELGQPMRVVVETEDPSGVVEAYVSYQAYDGLNRQIILNNIGGNTFEAYIPDYYYQSLFGDWRVSMVTLKDAQGNTSSLLSHHIYYFGSADLSGGDFTLTQDVTPPAEPVVNYISDKSWSISGTAEPNSYVEAVVGLGVIGSCYADWSGYYYMNINPQPAGAEVYVTASDSNGNRSSSTRIVVYDQSAPEVRSLSVDKVTVNRNETITVTAQIIDAAGNGVQAPQLTYIHSEDSAIMKTITLSPVDSNGNYIGTLSFDDADKYGYWTVGWIDLSDNLGNFERVGGPGSGYDRFWDCGITLKSDIEPLNIAYISTNEYWTGRYIEGDLYIGPKAVLTIDGSVTVNGNIYVMGALVNYGNLNVTGTIHAKRFNWGYSTLYNGTVLMLGGSNSISGMSASSAPILTPHKIYNVGDNNTFTAYDGTLKIKGAVLPIANVYIDGNAINYNYDGTFEVTLNTTNKTSFTLHIIDSLGNVKTVTYTIDNKYYDANRDGTINILDLAEISQHYNKSQNQYNWRNEFDLNNDRIIDIIDLVRISSKI